MRQEDNRQPMGSESLGTLVSSWRDGTFSEIWADWKWIWGYTKRYRRAVWFYTILGVASSTLGLVSAVASNTPSTSSPATTATTCGSSSP